MGLVSLSFILMLNSIQENNKKRIFVFVYGDVINPEVWESWKVQKFKYLDNEKHFFLQV